MILIWNKMNIINDEMKWIMIIIIMMNNWIWNNWIIIIWNNDNESNN